ncbi:hypothetical protein BC832DRAFT_538773 [Gaertneriomyces semiglobifer]|nr:hypothetical protein BC832DRAFT_538773 [Gaertneriomyces semiglobifer]
MIDACCFLFYCCWLAAGRWLLFSLLEMQTTAPPSSSRLSSRPFRPHAPLGRIPTHGDPAHTHTTHQINELTSSMNAYLDGSLMRGNRIKGKDANGRRRKGEKLRRWRGGEADGNKTQKQQRIASGEKGGQGKRREAALQFTHSVTQVDLVGCTRETGTWRRKESSIGWCACEPTNEKKGAVQDKVTWAVK